MLAGEAHDCPRRRSGNGQRQKCRSRAVSPKAITFILASRAIAAKAWHSFTARSGNGRKALTRLTPGMLHPGVPWASTTASSCAINSCCVAAHVPHRPATSELPTVISFRRRPVGSSVAFGWHATVALLVLSIARGQPRLTAAGGFDMLGHWLHRNAKSKVKATSPGTPPQEM